MTTSSSGSRLPDSFRSEWSPLHSLKPACTHHAYCSQQVPPQSTRAPQWYLTKSKASLIGTSVAIFAHGVEAITLFWQHSVSSVLAFPPLSLSLRFLLFQKTFIFHFTRGSDVFSAFQRSLQTGMSFRCTFIKPLYRCRLCADTYGPRVSFSSFSPGPFCDTIRESHSLPMKITAEFSGEFRALRCTW